MAAKKLHLTVEFKRRSPGTVEATVCFKKPIRYRGQFATAKTGSFSCGSGIGHNAAAALVDAMGGISTGLQFRSRRKS